MKYLILVCVIVVATSCAPEPGEKKVPVPAEKLADVNEGIDFQTSIAMDILFVIDDSYSMEKHQQKLIQGVNSFTDNFYNLQFINFHIGVTTSNTSDTDARTIGGRLIEQEGLRYIDRNTPDGDSKLKRMLNVGTKGGYMEEFFSMALAALTPPLSLQENAGFQRDHALQVVIFLTDTEDQSNYSADLFYDRMIAIKGSDDKFMLAAAVIPVGKPDCQRDPPEPKKIERAIKISNGFQFNICDVSFGAQLAELAEQVIEKVSVIRLSRVPIVSTIQVAFGQQVIPQAYKTGWTYDPNDNKIYLGQDIELLDQPGANLRVTFKEKLLE